MGNGATKHPVQKRAGENKADGRDDRQNRSQHAAGLSPKQGGQGGKVFGEGQHVHWTHRDTVEVTPEEQTYVKT